MYTIDLVWDGIIGLRALFHSPLIAENPVVGAGPEAREFQFRRRHWCGLDRVVAAKYSGPQDGCGFAETDRLNGLCEQ